MEPENHALDALSSTREEAAVLGSRGDFDAARQLWNRFGRTLRRARYVGPVWGAIHLALASLDLRRGVYGPALASAKRALDFFATRNRDPEICGARVDALGELGAIHTARGEYREAERAHRRGISLALARLTDLDATGSMVGLGVALKYQGRFDDAETEYRRALAILVRHRLGRSPLVATIFHNLGGIEHSRGRQARAERQARRSVRIRALHVDERSVELAEDRAALAAILDARGKRREAEALFRAAIAVFEKRLGKEHFEVGFNLAQLAALLQSEGKLARASVLYERAIAIEERALGRSDPRVALTLTNLGVLRSQQARHADAARLLRRAQHIFDTALGADHPDAIWCRENQAENASDFASLKTKRER